MLIGLLFIAAGLALIYPELRLIGRRIVARLSRVHVRGVARFGTYTTRTTR
ncbi:hypothetical protein [Actinocorallia longicatena]|uniref:Uncharacterized protein n=1 Tax=Actinocorallia longicatena TaxID=111803 RepID=A0ABP6QGI5_9ACTN